MRTGKQLTTISTPCKKFKNFLNKLKVKANRKSRFNKNFDRSQKTSSTPNIPFCSLDST